MKVVITIKDEHEKEQYTILEHTLDKSLPRQCINVSLIMEEGDLKENKPFIYITENKDDAKHLAGVDTRYH